MVVKCLVALALLGSLCNAQRWHDSYNPNVRYQNPIPPSRPDTKLPPPPPPPVPLPSDPQQSLQTFDKELEWKYPEDPTPEPQPEVTFEVREPVAASTVAVECRERDARVEAKKDFFGYGHLVSSADLTLGTCGAVAEDMAAQVLIFETELQSCGSTLTMTEDSLIYSFTLNYDAQQQVNVPVMRTSSAAVIVECHYPRKQNVSSLPLKPKWIPFSAAKVAEEFLYFNLKLMMDDWQYERPSYQYFLGDLIKIEASVHQYFHVPLRLYVDSCVATLSNDMTTPRYTFIENNGCLVDARLTGSDSQFMARTDDHKLQFQLEAFRFQGAESGQLYIKCHLKATSASYAVDSEHRACSFMNGWKEASGADSVCASCEPAEPSEPSGPSVPSSPGVSVPGSSWTTVTGSNRFSHPRRKNRDVSQSERVYWEGDVTLGPIPVGEKVVD